MYFLCGTQADFLLALLGSHTFHCEHRRELHPGSFLENYNEGSGNDNGRRWPQNQENGGLPVHPLFFDGQKLKKDFV